MSNLAIFNFESEPVRAITIDGEPWFVGKDICRVLEISDHKQALGRMPDDEVMLQLLPGRREGSGLGGYNSSTQGDVEGVDVPPERDVEGVDVPPEPKMSQFDAGDRKVKIISEPGFCRLVFTSRTERAERVKRWVFHEVLPTLRKTGQYNMAAEEAEPIDMQTDGRDLEPVDFDRIPTGHVRLAISLLREVRIVFGIPHARLVARHIGVTSTVLRLDQYREIGESVDDDIASFGRDRLIAVDKATATAADIYKSYVKWCRNNEIAPASQTMLGRRLRLMGFNKQQSSGTVRYLGVALSDAAE